jgi:hypothetical protein
MLAAIWRPSEASNPRRSDHRISAVRERLLRKDTGLAIEHEGYYDRVQLVAEFQLFLVSRFRRLDRGGAILGWRFAPCELQRRWY